MPASQRVSQRVSQSVSPSNKMVVETPQFCILDRVVLFIVVAVAVVLVNL